MKPAFLTGTKVSLRPLERSDAPELLPWVNDPAVTSTLLMHRPVNLQAEEAFIDEMTKSETEVVVGITLKESGKLIGAAGLNPIHFQSRQAQFGIFIGDKDEWGKGYATEATSLLTRYAFETLNLNRVWLHVTEENTAAIRAYEEVGFKREGLLRQAHYREGRYQNVVAMAIVREEWKPRAA